MMKMFWMIQDPIHELFELTENQRTKDPWMKAMLEADRYGRESWEIYCFVHGLPTRNVGSWLPDASEPCCGNALCQGLANKSWQQIQAEECLICQKERHRRCCIITRQPQMMNDELPRNMDRYQQHPFTEAPFVHPFRAPSYHAQHLRSIVFAKARRTRLLWVTAFDKMTTAMTGNTERAAERKERWLEYHERFTNGIPGLLPLVLNLPVRFTDSPNTIAREQGIFKHARGILRGWELDTEEEQRIQAMPDDAEIVLKKRPLKLFIEVPTANEELVWFITP